MRRRGERALVRGLGRASALLASGTVVSRLLGFVRTAVLAGVIGATGVVADAYSQAVYVPNSIYALIGGGLLTAVLVPQIVRASTGADRGQEYIDKLVTIAVLAFAVVGVLATLAAPVLMRIVSGSDAVLPIATTFAYWSIPQLFFLGLYAVLGEVLNARRSFGPYTWAPVLNNVVALASLGAFVVLFGVIDQRNPPVFSWQMNAVLAGGATLGIAAQALILLAAWKRAGLSYRPDFRWRGVHLSATGKAAGWTFAMLVLTQVAGLVQARVASSTSGAGTASVAVMGIAWLIFMLPHSIITVSLITVFYPRMSEHAAAGDHAALRGDVGQAMRIVLLFLVAADAALLAAAVPFSAAFSDSPAEARAVGLVLVAYLLGLLPFTALFVVQRAFYALADTRTPFLFTLAQVLFVIAGTLACILLPRDLTTAAIALTISLGALLQFGIAAVLLRRRIGGLGGRAVGGSFLRYLVAAVPAFGAGVGVLALLGGLGDGWAVDGKANGLVATALIAAAVAVVYLAVLALLRSPELRAALDLVRRRRAAPVE